MTISSNDNITNKRISMIIDFLESTKTNSNQYLSLERNITFILDIFMHRSYATIIFLLNEIKFSSQWELWKLSSLSALWEIDKRLMSLENMNIVERVDENDDEYCVIRPYWKTEHPTSPNLPVLYRITPIFKPVIDSFIEELRERYIWKSTFVQSMKRKARYESFYKTNAEKIFAKRHIELTKLGNCIACNKTIKEGSVKGTDFQKPRAGYVCMKCWKGSTKETRLQWMQSN